MTLAEYFLMFILYSFMGWVIEVCMTLYNKHYFVNRGFLVGPYCPIYGFGGVLITLFLTRYQEQPITLFVMAIFICGLLEYMTSYIMEKLFKARWWDYSAKKFNINGRICLETLVPFGLLGCVVIYITNPLLFQIFSLFTSTVLNIIAIILVIIFVIDLLVSFKIITNFRTTASMLVRKDSTEEISKKVKDTLDATTKLVNNRLVNAFPNVRKTIDEIAENMRRMMEEMDRKTSSKNRLIKKVKKFFKKD